MIILISFVTVMAAALAYCFAMMAIAAKPAPPQLTIPASTLPPIEPTQTEIDVVLARMERVNK